MKEKIAKLIKFLKDMNIGKEYIDPERLKGDFLHEYIEDIIAFEGSSADMGKVFEKYGNILLDRIINTTYLKDLVMLDENGYVRHDMDIVQSIQQIAYYEGRYQTVMKLEIVKLINHYTIERLMEEFDSIKLEIELGVYGIKTDRFASKEEKENADNRVKLAKTFGAESIQYIEKRGLLKERVVRLLNYTFNIEEKEKLKQILNNLEVAERLFESQDPAMAEILKECFNAYDTMNRQMLISRIKKSRGNITKSSNEVMLVHFIPNVFETKFMTTSMDREKNDFFDIIVRESIRDIIAQKYNRPYSPTIDAEEERELLWQWEESRKNPANIEKRIPIKNLYVNSDYRNVITQIHTRLSCSIANPGFVVPHLDRKIAIGFTDVPEDSIITISQGYNNDLDEYFFEEHAVPFPDALYTAKRSVENNCCHTNELLIDWTKVKPAYILVIKDKEVVDKNIMEEAIKLGASANLPIKIYDQYIINRNKSNPTDDFCNV